jgi:hypothetical protein
MNFTKDGIKLCLVKKKNDDSKKPKTLYLSDNMNSPGSFLNYNCSDDEELVVLPDDSSERECVCMLARSGAGKSYQAFLYIKGWLAQKKNKGKPVILFSSLTEDKTLDKIGSRLKRIKLNMEFLNKGVSLDLFKNSLVVFDDVDVISDKNIRKKVLKIQAAILQIGRHSGISCISTSHSFCSPDNKITINESSKFYLYPTVGIPRGLEYLLENYRGLTKIQIKKLKRNHGRFICIHSGKHTVVICASKAYVINIAPIEIESNF